MRSMYRWVGSHLCKINCRPVYENLTTTDVRGFVMCPTPTETGRSGLVPATLAPAVGTSAPLMSGLIGCVRYLEKECRGRQLCSHMKKCKSSLSKLFWHDMSVPFDLLSKKRYDSLS